MVCRHGNDSQLAVRQLRQLFEGQSKKSDNETKDGGVPESGPAHSKVAVVVRDIIGGLDRWSKEIDSTLPQY